MKHIIGTFKGCDGLNLYYQSWHPKHQSQAVVVLIHGLGGHSGLFEHVVQYLVAQSYDVYSFDLRGHGRSPGQRGYVHAWSEFREDLKAFLRLIHTQRSHCPRILWGHSMGGTIVLDYGLRLNQFAENPTEKVQGLIVTAPALGRIRVSPLKLALGRSLSSVMPRFSLKLGIRNGLASRDPHITAIYAQDTLRHAYGSARLATEFFATVNWIYKHANELSVPLLIMHGSADQIALPEASRTFFQRVIFPDKEHYEYPGNFHDLYVDTDYREIFTNLKDWLERHLVGVEHCQPLTEQGMATESCYLEMDYSNPN
jgi:alpha-beta hydrolase superfamily lysophospholipase